MKPETENNDTRRVLSLMAAFACFLLHPLSPSAQELARLETDAGLTLAGVLQQAYERSPRQQLLQAGSSVAEARARHAAGMLPGAPAVTARHQNDAVGSNRNLREWEAGLELPVWMPGQRAAREAVAREAKDSQEAGRTELMLEIAGQLRDALWDVALNRNAVDLAAQRLGTAQALQRDVERRQQAGELARTDLMLAQNESLQAQAALLRAQAELRHAEHRYWVLTGLERIPAAAEEPLTQRTGPDDSHPLLAAAARRIALAQEEGNLTRVEKRENPQLMLNVRHDRGAFDTEYDSSVGLALRIPLAVEARSAPLLAASEMNLAQARSERDQLLLTLLAAAHEAEHNLEVTRAELGVVEEQHRLAQENLRLARKAFALGETDLVHLLRVQALAFEAERALSGRSIQLKWDIARYNQAMGVLP